MTKPQRKASRRYKLSISVRRRRYDESCCARMPNPPPPPPGWKEKAEREGLDYYPYPWPEGWGEQDFKYTPLYKWWYRKAKRIREAYDSKFLDEIQSKFLDEIQRLGFDFPSPQGLDSGSNRLTELHALATKWRNLPGL